MSILYQLLIRIAALLVLVFTALRGLSDRSYWDRLPERLGFTRLRFTTAPIWVHAVSVGEVQAAAPLLRQLLRNTEARPVLFTTTTPTGAARVRALFAQQLGTQLQHAFLPYDTPGSVRRFLQRVQPHGLIIMETELWPNLLMACAARQIPVVLASARISLRTAGRYQRLRQVFVQAMRNVSVGAQTISDAERFVALGAVPGHVQVTGNIKFDIEVDAQTRQQGAQWRASWTARPVWVAGSTHAAEEEQVLAAHREILTTLPDCLLILAPRHPQRFAQVTQLLKTTTLRYLTRSSAPSSTQGVSAETQVLLLDTLGELNMAYAASDVAFVGGSLVPVGGHNLLEPAALQLPILTGPHVFNAPDIAAKLAEQAALRYVYSVDELAETVLALLTDPEARRKQGEAAAAVLMDSRGSLQRVMTLIAKTTGVAIAPSE